MKKIVYLMLFIFVTPLVAVTENKTVTKELETLHIEGTLHEPQILFFLEQPALKQIVNDEKLEHDYLKDIDTPLWEVKP